MQWIQANWLMLLSIWAALTVISQAIAPLVPPTSVMGKVLHVFVSLNALDVLKAMKAIGSAATPPVGGP